MIIKIIILSLWFTTSVFAVYPTDYMEMVLRAPNAAEARRRLGVTNGSGGFVQTNISYVAVTNAPWQWGNLNLTNWGTLSTNVLTNYIRGAGITTNTVWTRTYTYTNQVIVPNATFDTNGTITSWVSDGGQYRIDTVRELIVPVLGQSNDYEHDYGIYWTNAANERVSYLLSDNYGTAVITSTAGNTDYMTVKTFLVRAPSGQTVTITNRAFIAFANNIGGTNYISMEISKPSTIYGVIPQ